MSSQIKKQMAVLRSQAAEVFQRKAFKLAVWVGVFGSFSLGRQGETSNVNIVIFYDPSYPEKDVWEWYLHSEKNRWGTDPDEPKLKRVWGRKIDIVRIFAGAIHSEKDIRAILHAQTIYGNFLHPTLQSLRSSSRQKVEEYQKKIDYCEDLAYTAKESDGSKVGNPLTDISI
jgi:hypothetical protein